MARKELLKRHQGVGNAATFRSILSCHLVVNGLGCRFCSRTLKVASLPMRTNSYGWVALLIESL